MLESMDDGKMLTQDDSGMDVDLKRICSVVMLGINRFYADLHEKNPKDAASFREMMTSAINEPDSPVWSIDGPGTKK